LSDVNAARFRGPRDIGTVIHDKRDTLGHYQGRKPLRAFEQFARRRPLVPILEQSDTRIDKLLSALCFGNGKQCCV
jgi:hypothetical protein